MDMVLSELVREARSLPAGERLTLIGELCDTFDPDSIPVSDDEVRLVQERARRLEAHPEDELDWDGFQAFIDARLA